MSGIPPGYEYPPPQFQGGGPSPIQFLVTFQGIIQALNGQISALQEVAGAATGGLLAQITLIAPATAPAAPASGFTLYVDPITGDLMAVSSVGNRRLLASP